METQKRLSYTISSKPRRLTFRARPAAAVDDEETRPPSTPAPQFITEFDPSKSLTPAAAPAVVIAPIPNSSRLFQRIPCERTTEQGVVFTAESGDPTSSTACSSSNLAYGLNMPRRPALTEKKSNGDLMRLRFKQDIAALPDHPGAEEHRAVSGKEFAAAILRAYGWSEGEGIGRNNKEKGDTKVFCGGHRPGEQRQMFGNKKETEIGAKKKRMRENRDYIEKDSSTRQKRGGDRISGGFRHQ